MKEDIAKVISQHCYEKTLAGWQPSIPEAMDMAEAVLGVISESSVVVDKSTYDNLIADKDWLAALEGAGVDNWSGIDFARSIHEGEDG